MQRSHAELKAALILAGKEIRKLQFGRRTSPVLDHLRSTLKAAPIVAQAERSKVRVKLN